MTRTWQSLGDFLAFGVFCAAIAGGHFMVRQDELPKAQPVSEDAAQSCMQPADEKVAAIPQLSRMTVGRARNLLHAPQVSFVDAREFAAYQASHIPGAISLPLAEAERVLDVQSVPIPADNLVVTYCDGNLCELSEALGMLLRDRAGCQRVYVLEGGFTEWVAQSGPIERGVEASPVEQGAL